MPAVSVKLDITPAEFDLTRAAIETYKIGNQEIAVDHEKDAAVRAGARAQAALATSFLRKLNGSS